MNFKRDMTLILAATLVLGVSAAMADKLSDFQEAVKKDGCNSIPYSSLRSSCNSEQRRVHDYCDGRQGPVTCGSESITRQAKDNLEQAKKDVKALENKKRDLDNQKSRASDDKDKKRLDKDIEQVKKDIREAEKRVAKAAADLSTRKKLVDDAINTLGKCIDYRRAVMNSFADALDKVRGENDEAIKPLARQLRDRYEASKRGHEMAIKGKQNALDTCKKSRP